MKAFFVLLGAVMQVGIASGADRHFDISEFFLDCRYRVVESSSLFREAFTHPNISFTFRIFSMCPYLPYFSWRGGI